jgi:phosphomannomutase / phosphoglucomutase
MKLAKHIFRGYDIRGVFGEEIDEEGAEVLGKAYGTFLRKRKIKHAVVGRDCRLSGEVLQNALIKGMNSTGINVIDIGLTLSPIMYYAQYRYQTNGGVIVTASHNPGNYNGFKLANGYSYTTESEELQEIRKIGEEGNFVSGEGTLVHRDVKEDYYNDLLKRIKLHKRMKILIDTGNGTAGAFVPELLRKAGCEVVERNTNVDGNFPIGTPDPIDKEFLERLKRGVLEESADIGVCFDGDGDRIGVVDDKGNIILNDTLVAIFAKEVLERFPRSKIVFNGLCTQAVTKVIEQNNGIPVMWRTGHSFIKSKISVENATFGGELSGHFFFVDNFYGHDDGAFAILRLLEYLTEKNAKMSDLCEGLPKYISSPEIKIDCADDKKVRVVEKIAMKFKSDFPGMEVVDSSVIPGDDGTRIDFEDGMIIFRYSQNGPYMTVKFEAIDQETYDKRRIYVKEVLESYPEIRFDGPLSVNVDSLTKDL